MSRAIPEAGGGYSFASRAYRGLPAFLSGWFMWIGNVAYIALSSYTFALTLSRLLPLLPPRLLALLTVALFAIINYLGAKRAGRTQVLLTATVLAILVVFTLVGAFRFNWENFQPLAPNGVGSVFATVGYVYSIYIGFEMISNVAEEVKHGEVLVPRAIILTIGSAMALFPLVVAMTVGLLPQHILASSTTPLVDAASRLGPAAGWAMAFGGVVASLAALNAALIAAARITYALARDRYLPRSFMGLHPRFRSPHLGIGLASLVALLFVTTAHLDLMVYSTNFGYLFGLVLINAAAFRLQGLRWRIPYPLIPLLATATSIIVIPFLEVGAFLWGGVLTALGVCLYSLYRRVR
jgi:APA family basic amino acid/polyamine antiporter